MTIPPILTLFLTFHLLLPLAYAAEEEVRSLLEFRKGIKSDPSNLIFSTWMPPSNYSACPAAFHGVACDPSAHSIVAISLDHLGLSGDLKFITLIPLKLLQNLTLSGNFLSGRLVPTLGQMSSLQVMDLSGNQFYGPIPARFNDLWALHYVNFSNNNFSGGFPAGIRNLQQLKVLDLHSNNLQGSVAELIPELRNVEYLDLSRNAFSGSLELSVDNVSSLANTVKYVNLSGNGLTGGFWGSDAMMLFRNLRVLDLGDNGIGGHLPDFRQLPNLQVLRLGSNELYGSVPEDLLQAVVPLVELDLSLNGFSETTPRRYPPLSFSQRLKVAVDVARSLMFLHDRGQPHGNLKPTNILLAGPEYIVRLTDYGLHRLMTPAGIAEQILNLGALGYRSPELASAAKPIPSCKADVYAFGVIMMEILTRRSAGDIISGQSGAVDLTDWVRLYNQEGRGMECMDRDIAGGEQLKAIDDMLDVSLRCILPVNERPNIRQVIEELSSISV